MSILRNVILGAVLIGTVACGSAIEQQESSYKDRVTKLEALSAKADAPTKAEIETKKADIQKRYAALPADKSARSEPLGKLCQELKADIDLYEPKVEAASKSAEGADLAKGIAELAGHWTGGGIDLTIGADGSLKYEKKSANSSKSFSGKIKSVRANEFEAGALGINTTFKIDKRPYDEGGKKRMVIDGTPLTRD